MSRAQKGLLTNEEIVYTTKLHWNVLIVPSLLVLFITLPALYGYFVLQFAYKIVLVAVALVPLVLFFISYIKRNASEFAVTNMRVIIYLGVLSSQSFEVMLSKIESVAVNQNLMGKMLNYGFLEVGGTGGTKEKFSNIQNPFEFRKKVQEQMAKGGR
jgi:uncharacterized membrane protein YdbT with pleckstrin-like domain